MTIRVSCDRCGPLELLRDLDDIRDDTNNPIRMMFLPHNHLNSRLKTFVALLNLLQRL